MKLVLYFIKLYQRVTLYLMGSLYRCVCGYLRVLEPLEGCIFLIE